MRLSVLAAGSFRGLQGIQPVLQTQVLALRCGLHPHMQLVFPVRHLAPNAVHAVEQSTQPARALLIHWHRTFAIRIPKLAAC